LLARINTHDGQRRAFDAAADSGQQRNAMASRAARVHGGPRAMQDAAGIPRDRSTMPRSVGCARAPVAIQSVPMGRATWG
jgi:hypothetical protein